MHATGDAAHATVPTQAPAPAARLFAAAFPDPAARGALQRQQLDWHARHAGQPGLRWLPADALHLTLRFFGNTPADVLAPLQDALAGIARAHAACGCRLDRLEYWPAAAPRAVVLTGPAAPALQALAEALETRARALGFPPETRRFRPHVTLARHDGTPLPPPPAAGPVDLAVDAVALVHSLVGSGGARYRPLASFPLAPAAPERP